MSLLGDKHAHISDQDLLMALDEEQSVTRRTEIRMHLARCWACRARSSEIEAMIFDFMRVYRRQPLPSADGPRSLLKAQLAQLASRPPDRPRLGFRYFAVVAVLLVAVMVTLISRPIATVSASFVPDPRLTPGATRPTSLSEVCSEDHAGQTHPIEASVARTVFEEYRVRSPRPRAFEVDYLVSPELGGSDDIRNVWPEPYAGSEWNAHVKDALEDHLHEMVCGGTLDLTTAQHEIAQNWVAAYKKEFHTDHPLREHLAFTKDRPWE